MSSSSPRLVLVVDDDPNIRRLMLRALRHEDLRAVAVGSVAEALGFMEEEWPAALVVDYMLPHATGAELMRQVRRDMGDMAPPAILVTGSLVAVSDEERALFVSTREKPVSIGDIRAEVLRLVQGRPRQRSGVMLRAGAAQRLTGTDRE